MKRWMFGAVVVVMACDEARPGGVAFEPPTDPPHDVVEDGVAHARGMEVPFLCLDPSGAGFTDCPTDLRPVRGNLSCDASGCHGDHDYTPGADPTARHLLGSDGPSCYTCHEREWSEQTGGFSTTDER